MSLEPSFSRHAAWPPGGLPALAGETDDPPLSAHADAWRAGRFDPATVPVLADASATLAMAPVEPLAPHSPEPRGRTKAAIVASCLFHAALAIGLFSAPEERILIEGADQSGIMLLGDGPQDSAEAGDQVPDTAQVTLVTMLAARPVETVAAEVVAAAETVDQIDDTAIETVTAEPPPVPDPAASDVQIPVASPVARPAETTAVPVEAAPSPAAMIAASDPGPDILSVEDSRTSQENTVVPSRPAPMDLPETLQAEALEPMPTDAKVSADAASVQDVQPMPEAPTQSVQPVETTITPTPVEPTTDAVVPEAMPVPDPKPERPATAEKPPVKPKKESSPAPRKPAAKRQSAEKPAAKATPRKSGARGRNEASAARGVADGKAEGKALASGKNGAASAAGNAAVSNYPGRVAAKLRRAVAGIPRLARAGARRDVHVHFVVTASGQVASVRIARSSGSPALDTAALATVRRAAPFPPIPEGAGRSNWAFSVPLGVAR